MKIITAKRYPASSMHTVWLFSTTDRLPRFFILPPNIQLYIDLALSSESAALLCHSNTGLDTLGSDHFPIFTTINGNFRFKSVFLYTGKLKINNNDLNTFYHTLCNSLENLKSILSESPLLAYTHLESHIRNHSLFPPNSRLPRSRVLRQKPLPPPWWNEKCQLAVNERKEAINKYLAHPFPANFIAYKKIRSRCSKALKK